MSTFRNDISCKRKFAFDMESAAVRWDTHPGETMYMCTHCGFVHFAMNDTSRVDRDHMRALRIEAHFRANAPNPKAPKMRPHNTGYRKDSHPKYKTFKPEISGVYAKETSARVPVWFASGASIGELLAIKGIASGIQV